MPKDPKVEADKLREEAKNLLNRLILRTMNVPKDDSLRCSDADRIVDCIISVAILETVSMIKGILHGTDALTDKPADSTTKVSCGGSCNCHQS